MKCWAIPALLDCTLGSPARHKSGPSIFTDTTIAGIAKAHNVSASQVA